LIQRWYLLVGVGLVGALLASFVVILAPKRYQAQAVVMVDQQVELAVPPLSPVDDTLYISRETVRLEELSYADSLWERVYTLIEVSDFEAETTSIDALQELVSAPHYQDGAWYFTVEHSDPAFAAVLANAWAESFTDTVQGWIETAQEERSLQAQLEQISDLQASSVDECVQIEWTAMRVAELHQSVLAQPGIPQDQIDQTVSRIRQLAYSASLAPLASPSTISLEEAIRYSQSVFAALEEEVLACRGRLDALQAVDEDLVEQLTTISVSSYGVSPYLRIQFTRPAVEPHKPTIKIGNAALSGFVVTITLWIMADIISFSERTIRRDRGDT
jgi:capsular polysaccharide biosynthesis protein